MSAPHRWSLRVVIQPIGSGRELFFRVAAYGDKGPLGHSDFNSAQALLEALNAAVPDFQGAAHLLDDYRESNSHIVFSGPMVLDDSQLAILGLK